MSDSLQYVASGAIDHTQRETTTCLESSRLASRSLAWANNGSLIIAEVVTAFADYDALPCDAWNNKVIGRVYERVAEIVRLNLKRFFAGTPARPFDLGVSWLRIHKNSSGQPQYHQVWYLGQYEAVMLTSPGVTAWDALTNVILDAWLTEERQAHCERARQNPTFCLHRHSFAEATSDLEP